MAHNHSVYDGDTHFKIDPVTRQIENTSGKVILMQNDHNSERFTFEIPRIIDGHDMSQCNAVEVHYINVDGKDKSTSKGVYPIEDLQISPDSEDVVICSWLISHNATKYAGTLNFVLRYACLTDEIIDYQWFTDIHKGISVSESISNTAAVINDYADVLAEWEARIEALEQGGGKVELDTTLTQEGKAADAKAVGDALAELEAQIPESGGGNNVSVYKTEDIGELFPAPSNYTAWCPGNLRYDKALGKFVSLLYAAPGHVHSESALYVTHIDPESFVATEPVKCKYVDTDGVTDITPASAGACSFLILSDGTYLLIHEAADGNTYKFTSADNGVTWQKLSAVTGYSGTPWNMTELSNGRIIVSDDNYGKMYYSDDKGVTWTQTTPPNTAGGNYECEACILEVEPGKLIAIARYSMSGKGYYESGDSEPAIFASSLDYGTTWTGWEISTIDNMNASSCTGIVHDGIVEIFATSRWYSNGGNVNTDNANTGKNGAMLHYMATAENALKNNFTRVGIVDYAKGAGGEYHSPCAALDDKNRMLIVHMDGGESVTCNNRYLRGELNGINYAVTDDGASSVKAYSAKTVEALMAAMKERVDYLQLMVSKIDGSGVDAPEGVAVPVLTWLASDGIQPWETASALYNMSEGLAAVSEFLQDADGEAIFKSYNNNFRLVPTENASDFYLKYEYLNWSDSGISTNGFAVKDGRPNYLHVVKDGYITVFDYYAAKGYHITLSETEVGGVQQVNDNNVLGKDGNHTVEMHDGYVVIDGVKFVLPRIPVEDFVNNWTDYPYYTTHKNLGVLKSSSMGDNHCAMGLQQYKIYKNMYLYEKN